MSIWLNPSGKPRKVTLTIPSFLYIDPVTYSETLFKEMQLEVVLQYGADGTILENDLSRLIREINSKKNLKPSLAHADIVNRIRTILQRISLEAQQDNLGVSVGRVYQRVLDKLGYSGEAEVRYASTVPVVVGQTVSVGRESIRLNTGLGEKLPVFETLFNKGRGPGIVQMKTRGGFKTSAAVFHEGLTATLHIDADRDMVQAWRMYHNGKPLRDILLKFPHFNLTEGFSPNSTWDVAQELRMYAGIGEVTSWTAPKNIPLSTLENVRKYYKNRGNKAFGVAEALVGDISSAIGTTTNRVASNQVFLLSYAFHQLPEEQRQRLLQSGAVVDFSERFSGALDAKDIIESAIQKFVKQRGGSVDNIDEALGSIGINKEVIALLTGKVGRLDDAGIDRLADSIKALRGDDPSYAFYGLLSEPTLFEDKYKRRSFLGKPTLDQSYLSKHAELLKRAKGYGVNPNEVDVAGSLFETGFLDVHQITDETIGVRMRGSNRFRHIGQQVHNVDQGEEFFMTMNQTYFGDIPGVEGVLTDSRSALRALLNSDEEFKEAVTIVDRHLVGRQTRVIGEAAGFLSLDRVKSLKGKERDAFVYNLEVTLQNSGISRDDINYAIHTGGAKWREVALAYDIAKSENSVKRAEKRVQEVMQNFGATQVRGMRAPNGQIVFDPADIESLRSRVTVMAPSYRGGDEASLIKAYEEGVVSKAISSFESGGKKVFVADYAELVEATRNKPFVSFTGRVVDPDQAIRAETFGSKFGKGLSQIQNSVKLSGFSTVMLDMDMEKLSRHLQESGHSKEEADTFVRRLASINTPVPAGKGASGPPGTESAIFSSNTIDRIVNEVGIPEGTGIMTRDPMSTGLKNIASFGEGNIYWRKTGAQEWMPLDIVRSVHSAVKSGAMDEFFDPEALKKMKGASRNKAELAIKRVKELATDPSVEPDSRVFREAVADALTSISTKVDIGYSGAEGEEIYSLLENVNAYIKEGHDVYIPREEVKTAFTDAEGNLIYSQGKQEVSKGIIETAMVQTGETRETVQQAFSEVIREQANQPSLREDHAEVLTSLQRTRQQQHGVTNATEVGSRNPTVPNFSEGTQFVGSKDRFMSYASNAMNLGGSSNGAMGMGVPSEGVNPNFFTGAAAKVTGARTASAGGSMIGRHLAAHSAAGEIFGTADAKIAQAFSHLIGTVAKQFLK